MLSAFHHAINFDVEIIVEKENRHKINSSAFILVEWVHAFVALRRKVNKKPSIKRNHLRTEEIKKHFDAFFFLFWIDSQIELF